MTEKLLLPQRPAQVNRNSQTDQKYLQSSCCRDATRLPFGMLIADSPRLVKAALIAVVGGFMDTVRGGAADMFCKIFSL